MPDPGGIGRAGRYYAVAFDFTGAIMAGVVGGWMVDNHFGTAPYGGLTLIIAGVVVGFVRLVRALRRFEQIDRDPGH